MSFRPKNALKTYLRETSKSVLKVYVPILDFVLSGFCITFCDTLCKKISKLIVK